MRFSFETERLYIELYQKVHIKRVLNFYIKNKEALEDFEPEKNDEFFTLKYHKNRFKHDKRDMDTLRYLSFILFKKEDRNSIIGFVNFFDITFGVFDSCRVGYKVDVDERNNGYMQEALKKLTGVIFEELKLHRIEANVMPHNLPSIKLLEKLGFEKEGYGKKYLKINGKWQDHIHFILLNEKEEE